MSLRSTPRRNKDGSEVRYLQLAHNVWDPAARRPKVRVVYSFDREDSANREALQRLVAAVTRFLEPGKAWPRPGKAWGLLSPGRWAAPGHWMRCGCGWGSGRRCGGS